MRGRAKGSKNQMYMPSSYEIGIPAVNFFLAILNTAKKDKAQMWLDFQGTELYKIGLGGSVDGFGVAEWVSKYIGG